MLVYTSLLFATIDIHAFYARQALYHHLFLAVTICSVLRYTTDHPMLHKIDTFFAHAAFLAICLDWDTPKYRPWVLFFPVIVLAIWIAEHVWPEKANLLHAVLHVVSVAGVHCYLY